MKKIGILFDLDGTLWDVTDSTYESVNKIASKYGLSSVSKNTICSVFGINKLEAANRYFPSVNSDMALRLLDEMVTLNVYNLRINGGSIYMGIEDTLINLRSNYELFIVSNTSKREYIEAFLTSSSLGKYFKDYVAVGALDLSKAEAIKKVVEDYKLDKAVYVGDIEKDFISSKEAGAYFIHARYGFDNNLKTKYFINNLLELPSVVEEIFKQDSYLD